MGFLRSHIMFAKILAVPRRPFVTCNVTRWLTLKPFQGEVLKIHSNVLLSFTPFTLAKKMA